ncbi:GAF domain-containing SpoIIE family protein phosphatase [Saccharothrix sp. ST-888]|uniref:GAF domain-containing SpoIIE family protein phosphatase n=1 Tax=Saccharothrix sp. ST-888 TaxID=1427391 RepID=UPI0005EC7F7E|nr:GAF domain-containing SpoIIE family protein phosphatase [Saccharothrix sp. ST-888]KJK55106.1 PAS/PAC sensor protein [Saccharothrix sp. ST-888]
MSTSQPALSRLGSSGTKPVAEGDLGALARILRSASGRLGAHVGGLYLLGGAPPVLHLTMTLGAGRQFTRPWERVGLAAPIPVADAARDGRLVWVGGAAELARRYPRVAVAMPYAFCLAAIPLATPQRTYGAVFLLWPAAHPPELSPQERDRLIELARGLTGELERAERAGQPARPGRKPLGVSTERASALSAMTARLPEGLCAIDQRGLLTVVTETAADLLGEPADRLIGARPWVALPWLRDPVYEDRYRAAVISGQPTSFVALRPPDRWLSFRLFPDVSGLTLRITDAEVAEHELEVFQTATSPDIPTRAGVLYHILHLAGALTEAVSVQDVVSMISDQIVPAFGGQAVAVLLAESGRLRIVGHRGYPPGLVEQFDSTPLTAATPGVQALTNPVPAFFETRAELERLYPGRRETQDGMAAWAYLPLVVSGRLIGTCVLAFAEAHRFTVDERAVLTALGGLIAQALDRARLYDTKLSLAQGLQESLLPHALPVVPGLETSARYLPCTDGMDIGGDFYDLIRIDGDTAAIVIGDVEGHNVNAAALMGQIRTAVHAFATADADPSTVLGRTNRLLFELGTTLLASCACLRVDLSQRVVRLANAGHPPPLLCTGGRVQVLREHNGMVLNVERAACYPLTRVELPIGSTLALYTDGLVEDPGADLDHVLDGLGSTFARCGGEPLEQVADSLISHAERSRHRTDDIALLLVRSVPR